MTTDTMTIETAYGPLDIHTSDGIHFGARSHTGSGYRDTTKPIVINGVSYSLWFNLCAGGCCETPGYMNNMAGDGLAIGRVSYLGCSRLGSFRMDDATPAARKIIYGKLIPDVARKIAAATDFIADGKTRGVRDKIVEVEAEIAELETKLLAARAKLAELGGIS